MMRLQIIALRDLVGPTEDESFEDMSAAHPHLSPHRPRTRLLYRPLLALRVPAAASKGKG